MNLLLYMAPVAVVILLPATLLMEDIVVGITIALARKDVNVVWYLLFNSGLAYLVNLTNFLVTKHTSALTLQVYSLLIFQQSNCLLFRSMFLCKLLKLQRYYCLLTGFNYSTSFGSQTCNRIQLQHNSITAEFNYIPQHYNQPNRA